jgi:capsular polysaccharide transport system permease protein
MVSVLEILEPIFLIGLLTAAWQFLDRRRGSPLGDSAVLFYATGFFFLYYFIYISNRMRRAIEAPTRRFPIERRLDHIIVHVMLRTIDYGILGVVLFTLIYIFSTETALPTRLTPLFLAFGFAAMLGFGWGIFNLVVSRAWRFWAYIFPLVNRSLIILTGVVYIADFLAPTPRYVLSFIPLVHAMNLFRSAFYHNQPTIILDISYLAWCSIVAVALGLAIERLTVRAES